MDTPRPKPRRPINKGLHINEYKMVEETHTFKIWPVLQTIAGALVVAGLLGVTGAIISVRDTVLKHDVLISQLAEFKNTGDRYTAQDGQTEREQRMEEDIRHRKVLDELNANQVRMWAAIREHIEKSQHQGADYRLKRLEEKLK